MPQKITLGEMRRSGVRGLLVYCSDYKCSHSTAISAEQERDIGIVMVLPKVQA